MALASMVAFAIVSARWLGPAGKGELTLVISAGTLAGAVFSLGLPQGLTTWVSRDIFTARDAAAVGLPIVVVLPVLLWLGGAALGADRSPAVAFLSISVAAFLYEQVAVGIATGLGDLRSPLVLRTVCGLLLVGVFGLAWLAGWAPSLEAAVWAYFAVAALGITVSLLGLLRRAGPEAHGRAHLRGQLRPLASFGLAVVPGLLLGVVNYRADILLLGWLAGAAAVGVYSVAVSATLLVGLVPAALGQALTRTFGTSEDPRAVLRRAMQASIVGALLTAAVIGLGSWLLVVPVFGARFAEAGTLIAVMVPFTGLYSGSQVSFVYFHNSLRRPILQSGVIGVTAFVDVTLVLLLAPRYGAMGAALASAAAYGSGAVANLIISSRSAGIPLRALILSSRDDLRWMWNAGLRLLRVERRGLPDARSL